MKWAKWLDFILALNMLSCKTFSASVNREITLANSSVEGKGIIHPGGTRTLEGLLISFLIYSENRFFLLARSNLKHNIVLLT